MRKKNNLNNINYKLNETIIELFNSYLETGSIERLPSEIEQLSGFQLSQDDIVYILMNTKKLKSYPKGKLFNLIYQIFDKKYIIGIIAVLIYILSSIFPLITPISYGIYTIFYSTILGKILGFEDSLKISGLTDIFNSFSDDLKAQISSNKEEESMQEDTVEQLLNDVISLARKKENFICATKAYNLLEKYRNQSDSKKPDTWLYLDRIIDIEKEIYYEDGYSKHGTKKTIPKRLDIASLMQRLRLLGWDEEKVKKSRFIQYALEDLEKLQNMPYYKCEVQILKIFGLVQEYCDEENKKDSITPQEFKEAVIDYCKDLKKIREEISNFKNSAIESDIRRYGLEGTSQTMGNEQKSNQTNYSI